jgi:hypothetical protein
MRLKSNEMDKHEGLKLSEQILTVLTEVRGLQERWHNQVEAKQRLGAARGWAGELRVFPSMCVCVCVQPAR